jgi:hypothetical protein
LALLAGFFFGSTNFLYNLATIEIMTIRTVYPSGFGLIILFIVFHSYHFANNYREKGYIWSRSNSAYFKSDKSLNWMNIFAVFGRTVESFYSIIGLFWVIKVSIDA